MATDRRYSSAYDRLQSQGTVSMFGNTPVSKLPEYYKAENQQKTPISTSLYEAAKEGNLVKIQECLSEGGNPNWFNHDDEGATALFAACIGGHLEAARALVAGGAAVEPRLLTSKDTVLHMCCAHNRLEILQFLVEGPAADMVDAENTFGNTPLHVACMGSNPDMVRFLLQHGASSRRANKRGSSALHFAAYSPGGAAALAALVGAVLDAGAAVDHADRDGQTALHVAAYKGHLPLCRLLVGRGAPRAARDGRGKCPRDFAEVKGNLELIDLLDPSVEDALAEGKGNDDEDQFDEKKGNDEK